VQQLNHIDEAGLRAMLGVTLGLMERIRASARPANPDISGRLLLELGLLRHALEEGDPVECWRAAAPRLAEGLRARPEDKTAARNPYDALRRLSVIAVFANAPTRAAMAGLALHQLANPPSPAYAAPLELLSLLLPILGGDAADAGALTGLAESLETSDTTPRAERRLIAPLARGLAAVAAADAEAWNLAVAQTIAFQAEQSERGDMKRMVFGLTSFEGLMLAQIGLARGMPLRAVSAWLPLGLLPKGGAS